MIFRKVRDKLAFEVFGSNRTHLLSRAKFPVIAEEVVALAERLGRPPRVLDAGIGRCRLERYCHHHHDEVDVEWHGIDLLDFRLRLQEKVPAIQRVRGRLEALPYADHAFDAVVCCWVLQHLEDPTRALAEFARVLRPGGTLLLAVPHSPGPVRWVQERVHPAHVRRQRERGTSRFSYLPQIQFFDLPRMRRLLGAIDAEAVRWQGIGVVTGGPIGFLENHAWYYRANLRFGARFPRCTKQLVVVARTSGPRA
jgi:SAM-dependent methyltransferase